MRIQNKTEAGMSFVELMIAGLLLLIVALAASTTFISSSRTIIKSWDESVAVARAQELLEEVKGLRYEYIHQAAATGTVNAAHLHLNIINPVIMPQGQKTTDVQVRVIAHTADDYIATGHNLGSLDIKWEYEGTSTKAGKLQGGDGIKTATITLTTNNPITKRLFGTLSVTGTGTLNSNSQRVMIFPGQGESIAEKDMIGTITMSTLFIDDSADGVGANDIFPDDYKQIAVTVIGGKSGGKSCSRQLVTIIAPKPASYY
ncbi:MAG: hypothetical protein ABH870_03870 [bacterium]